METAERMDSLERENRWLRRLVVVLLPLVALNLAVSTYLLVSANRRAEAPTREIPRLSFGEGAIANAKCKEYYDSARTWKMFMKKLPESLREMAAPLTRDEEDFIRVESDPWGNPYVLERKGREVRVYSFCADGRKGTHDDIAYP